MKAIVHERYGRPDVLELREVDMPEIAGRSGPRPRPRRIGQPR